MSNDKHLNNDQIAGWISGERDNAIEQHLAGCGSCRAKVEGFLGKMSAAREITALRATIPYMTDPTPRAAAIATTMTSRGDTLFQPALKCQRASTCFGPTPAADVNFGHWLSGVVGVVP